MLLSSKAYFTGVTLFFVTVRAMNIINKSVVCLLIVNMNMIKQSVEMPFQSPIMEITYAFEKKYIAASLAGMLALYIN